MDFSTEALVVDTSAIVALIYNEPEAKVFFDRISQSDEVWLSGVSKVETMMVLTARFSGSHAPARESAPVVSYVARERRSKHSHAGAW